MSGSLQNTHARFCQNALFACESHQNEPLVARFGPLFEPLVARIRQLFACTQFARASLQLTPYALCSANSLKANTGIDDPLLSRFDLIFLMLDTNSVERDGNIVDHILNMAIRGDGVKPVKAAGGGGEAGPQGGGQMSLGPAGPESGATGGAMGASGTTEFTNFTSLSEVWKLDEIRSYIATVKDRIQPVLSKEATVVLSKHYSYCRWGSE